MKVQMVNHAREDFQVHKVGCMDIARDQKKRLVNSTWVIEVPEGKTISKAASDELNASFGWSEGDEDPEPWPESYIRVMPCCKDAK